MALGDGATWNESLPDNDTDLVRGDDYQRDLRVGVRSRMAHEHLWPSSQTGTAQAGYHKWVTFQPATTNPSDLIAGTTAGAISFVSSAGYQMLVADSAGRNVQVTYTGGLHGAGIHMSGQTKGGMAYAAGATTAGWSVVGIGTTNDIMYSVNGTAPGWISRADFGTAFTGGSGIVAVGDVTSGTWNSSIGTNRVLSVAISSGAVTAAKIGSGAVTNGHIGTVLGGWTDLSLGSATTGSGTATTDMLLCAFGTFNGFIKGYTPAGTQRAYNGDAGGGGIMMPVKSGNTWTMTCAGGGFVAAYTIALGAGL